MRKVVNGKKLNKNVSRFISHVEEHLSQWGVRIIWGRGRSVHCYGYTSAGFFCDEDKVIKIASKNTFWLDTIVHEYAHFLQWIEGSHLFRKSGHAIHNVDQWFNREEITKKRLSRSFYIIRSMERDCEIRACRLARKFDLPIRKEGYAKRANLYIYTHWIMEEKRKFWAYKKDPMQSKYILSLMPNNFRMHTHKRIPPKILKALVGYTKV